MDRTHEILDDLDLLARPAIDLERVSVGGIAFGSFARDIPREQITDVTCSPIVHSYRGGTNLEPEFFDAHGAPISIDEVIDSVIDANGILHLESKISFRIAKGLIDGFTFYGDHLRHFGRLRSVEECIARFGIPDRKECHEAYGDLMGYDLTYFRSSKLVGWGASDERISHIILRAEYGYPPK
jgi:hypothetical protein